MSKRNKILAHLTFWSFSITMSCLIWGMPHYKEGYLWSFIQNQFYGHGSTIVYFYINYFILVPFLLEKKRYFSFAFATALNIEIHIIVCSLIWYQTFEWAFTFSPKLGPMTYESIYLTIISTGYRMFEFWDKSEEHKNQLEKEVKDAEMLFLQSQMSPHFLFNTLNNIYGLSLNNSPHTSKSVGELKKLMHYFEQFEKGQKIKLLKEVEHLNAFIELNRLRNPVKINLTIEILEKQKELDIEPMLLLPFIENAFKHGDLNKEISISLFINENQLHFKVANQINIGKRKDNTGGIGIPNVQRRLELLYPQKHTLEITNAGGLYISKMTIQLA